jgi:hypothetical protein
MAARLHAMCHHVNVNTNSELGIPSDSTVLLMPLLLSNSACQSLSGSPSEAPGPVTVSPTPINLASQPGGKKPEEPSEATMFTAWNLCRANNFRGVVLANRHNILLPSKPLNHQVVIHYGRIMSNKTFSITRGLGSLPFRLINGRLPSRRLVGASTDELPLVTRFP